MGTRNLTAVVIDGDFKIAQYGQWDGYPEGQGATVLHFLQTADLGKFREAVRSLHWITPEEEAARVQGWKDAGADESGWVSQGVAQKFMADYPKYSHLSRDVGAAILERVYDGDITFVVDSRGFGNDDLFCEWAYVVDLDNNVLEVYEGGGTLADGRWPNGIPLATTFPLPELADFTKDDFVKAIYAAVGDLPDEEGD